ncbi:MAG TPA: type VI secretion system tube protein Hcp [Urbifossiella sp.]|nr:type VI secretion system tube protein Hcp [Urbifossiella sp.]
MPIYMQYDSGKIKGDVTAKGHEDWIELASFGWGVGRGISPNYSDRVQQRGLRLRLTC